MIELTDWLKRRRTKIVATLGPASASEEVIAELIRAGADLFRLNMSHGTHDQHRATFAAVRKVSAEIGKEVAILADLCGPKIRVGKFEEGSIELEVDEEVTVTTAEVIGKSGLIPCQYEALARDAEEGDRVLLDDGRLELEVLGGDDVELRCRVKVGGTLKERKGMHLPGVAVSAPALTEKDHVDARFALELPVDYFALSFVRRPEDLEPLRAIISEAGQSTPIISKIEKPEALENIQGILATSDGIMVARGDLGVELPPEQVPIAQQQLIDAARKHSLPVIVATQMLESMIESSTPTRAEVSDVANAVLAGTDAVMLSAETAAGRYPVEAVQVMDRVARQTESYLWQGDKFGALGEQDEEADGDTLLGLAIARSTAQLSRDLHVRAIGVFSHTGRSVREVSSSRPAAPVLALSDDPSSHRRLCLLWGVLPQLIDAREAARPEDSLRWRAAQMGLTDIGQNLLLVRGFHPDPEQSEPSITVLRA
ncbi:MAG: pyruvate kinase [Acidobacteriota bacterium]